ncbi:hypothetical protein C8J57DRAFT_1504407 [Mycena rebaudengoi]|nr:hypothetical protein C8J57DRAFT_1504407 [Mycena rebaudengoi]
MPKSHYTSLLASLRGGLVILMRLRRAAPPSIVLFNFGRSRRHIRHIPCATAPFGLIFPWRRDHAQWSFHLHASAACSRPCPFSSIFRGLGVVQRTLRGVVVHPSPPRPFFIEIPRFPPSFRPPSARFSSRFFGVPAIRPTRLPFWRSPDPVFPSPRVAAPTSISIAPRTPARWRRGVPLAMRSAVLARFSCPSNLVFSIPAQRRPQLLNTPFTVPPSHRRVAPPSHILFVFRRCRGQVRHLLRLQLPPSCLQRAVPS